MYICIKYLKQFLENLITVYMHTIKRLVVDLNLPNRIGEHEGVDEANRLYDRYIKDTLDNVLSSYPEEIELIFPELIIDLGEIESYNMPAEIERRLPRMHRRTVVQAEKSVGNHFNHSWHILVIFKSFGK